MRPHKVVFERVASHYPQERKRSTKIKPYFVPARPKHTGKNIEHPLVCAYKTTLTRPATATVYRARYLKRFELHNLGKPSYGSDSPPSRSEQNLRNGPFKQGTPLITDNSKMYTNNRTHRCIDVRCKDGQKRPTFMHHAPTETKDHHSC